MSSEQAEIADRERLLKLARRVAKRLREEGHDLSPDAFTLHVLAIDWSRRNGTNGFIPEAKVSTILGEAPTETKSVIAKVWTP